MISDRLKQTEIDPFEVTDDERKAYYAALFATLAECMRQELMDTSCPEEIAEFRRETSKILFEGLGQITKPIQLTYAVDDGRLHQLVFNFCAELKPLSS